MKVSFQEMLRAFEKSDRQQSYVDLSEGRVVYLPVNPDSEAELLDSIFSIEEDWQRYVPVPNVLEEQEHDMMEAFARTQAGDIQRRLLDTLQGTGAIAHFQSQVKRLLLRDAWEKHCRDYRENLVRLWCEENHIPYNT